MNSAIRFSTVQATPKELFLRLFSDNMLRLDDHYRTSPACAHRFWVAHAGKRVDDGTIVAPSKVVHLYGVSCDAVARRTKTCEEEGTVVKHICRRHQVHLAGTTIVVALLFAWGGSWCQTPEQFSITLLADSVGRYEKLEIVCDGITTSYSNPYDPGEVSVDGHFTDPDGQEHVVPGFWYQDYTRSLQGGNEVLTAVGTPHWRVRYAPAKTGNYSCRVTVTDAGGTVSSETATFTVVDSDNPGFIRVSKTNGCYFEFDNGDTFWGIGPNLGWAPDANHKTTFHEQLITELSDRGGNFYRQWMENGGAANDHDYGPIRIQFGTLGADYNLKDAWCFDYVLNVAHQHDVYIMLTLGSYHRISDEWDLSIYNAANGGPCTTKMAVFNDEIPREAFRRLLRYLVARYGYSTNIFSWAFWNEINEAQWNGPPDWNWGEVIDWHAYMSQYVKSIDPYGHIVSTSTGSFNVFPDLYGLAGMEYAQIHGYYLPGWTHHPTSSLGRDMANFVRYYAELVGNSVDKKPCILGEFGLRNASWGISEYLDGNAPDDFAGIHLHNAYWSGLMNNLAATPMSFEWHYFDPPSDYGYPAWLEHHTGIAKFLEGIQLSHRSFVTLNSDKNDTPVKNPGFELDLSTGWTRNPGDAPFVIDSAVSHSGQRSVRFESASARSCQIDQVYWQMADWSDPFILLPDRTYQLSAWVRTENVDAGSVRIYFGVYDGAQWHNFESDPLSGTNEWTHLVLNFTTPQRVSELFHFGGSVSGASGRAWWDDFDLQLADNIAVDNGDLRAMALKDNSSALVWLQNKQHTWYNVVALQAAVPPVSGASMTVPKLDPGDYTIEWWDTYAGVATGTTTASTNAAGTLVIPLPTIEKDVACKITRSGEGGGDTVPPTTPAISTPSQVVNADTVAVELSAPSTDENFSNYQVMGGQYTSWTNTSETGPFIFTLVQNATNTLSIRGRDTSGNVSSAASVLITEDSVLPTTPVLATSSQVVDSESITVALATPSTDDHFSTYQLRGGQYASWTDVPATDNFEFTLTQDAAHTLRVRGKDQAGNVGGAATIVVDEDSTLPTAPVIATQPQETNADSVTVTLASPSTDAHFACYQLRGGQYADWTDTTETDAFAFTLNQNAENVLQVRAKDSAGHVSAAASVTITQDSEAPLPPPGQAKHVG